MVGRVIGPVLLLIALTWQLAALSPDPAPLFAAIGRVVREERLQRKMTVAELGQPGLHGDADGGAHLDGVQPDVVVEPIQLGDHV